MASGEAPATLLVSSDIGHAIRRGISADYLATILASVTYLHFRKKRR
jgi:hypothetical protein